MRPYKRGFTIVELVIIMAVIAILAAVLIPTLSGMITKANYSKMISDCTNALIQYKTENPLSNVQSGNDRYSSAYFIVKNKDRLYYFMSGSEKNITEISEVDLPDFSACAYADLYIGNPIELAEDERISQIVNYYRIDDLSYKCSVYFLASPFDENGIKSIFIVTDFAKEYYFLNEDYYTLTKLSDVVLNEERAPHIDPETGYIEDQNGIRYSSKLDGTSEIAGYVGTSGELVIPRYSPDGKLVTSIGLSAIEANKNVVSVVLPEGLTTVGGRAFYNCSNLETVSFPSTLENLESASFYGCNRLSGVTLPQSLKLISKMTFCGCPAVSDLVLPVNATLKSGCLAGVKGLTFAGDNAYETDKYKIDGNCLIDKTTGILISGNTESVIPTDGSVTTIGENSFSYIRNKYQLNIPQSVTKISENAFYGSGVTELTGGEALRALGDSAFCDSGLTAFTLSSSIESMGISVFSGCSNLKLTIENGIIIDNSISGGLKEIVIRDDNPDYKKSGSAIIKRSNNTIITSEKQYAFPSEPGEYIVGQSAFAVCATPENYVLPESIKYLGNNSFSRITSKTIKVTENVESIGAAAFSFCYELISIEIACPIKIIDSLTFRNDRKLTEIKLPKTIELISSNCFMECVSLSRIYFEGTRNQWKAIQFEPGWNSDLPSYTVYCSDGELSMIKS
ncbi:MAG: leucine-rich repeat protein [Clostridia bacterium]|nr:leucine-rich repeat protein [Clostridia bacterium]